MTILKGIILAVIGFSSGAIVAGGIFAFIAIIGVVPRMAQRTRTMKYIPIYEDAISLGGIFGTLTMFVDFYLPIGPVLTALFAFAIGIFVGGVAVSLAEVINVVPIFMRRAHLTKGIPVLIAAVAIGKCVGSLAYFYLASFTA